ncbi:hypothetical protein [Streptococcus oricebi]|uniref:Uncharacterized protein n=1 Tax=Streptococcus oricebi TaxID=1547447 RepID=A0ABS5B5U0_9STRE|nr:hypothetical protein [Streptococcus oricebi]MBP2624208.1 hypothetical protein [Streptococcus oricebi]
MTKYYSHKPDFEKGSRTGAGSGGNWNNVSCVTNILKNAQELAQIVESAGLSDLYIATGEATLGKDMPEKTFLDAEHHAIHRLEAAKRAHREIMQNIDGKFFEGLDKSLTKLNQVNEGKNTYKSKHLTYETTVTTYDYNGYSPAKEKKVKVTEHYTLKDIINSPQSPIQAAKSLYDGRLKLAKEHLKTIEKQSRKQYEELKKLKEPELVEALFPTQLGEYEQARSTFKEANKDWLGWVVLGVKVVGGVLIIGGVIASGGTAAPALAPWLTGAGTIIVATDSGIQAISGETLSGTVLTPEERAWAAADAVLTGLTGGLATRTLSLANKGQTMSTTMQTVAKLANYTDDVVDVARTVRLAQDDPLGAVGQFVGSRALTHGLGAIGKKLYAKANIDVEAPKVEKIERYSQWEEMKLNHKQTVTDFVATNRPSGAPHPREWLKVEGNEFSIEHLSDGTQTWRYKNAQGVEKVYIDGLLEGAGSPSPITVEHFQKLDKRIQDFDPEVATTTQKGNVGEILADQHLLQVRDKVGPHGESYHLERIGRPAPESINEATVKGIDGIYKNSTPPPSYVINEAKFGSSQLNAHTETGPQMSKKWIEKRLFGLDEVEQMKIRRALRKGDIDMVVSKVDYSGNITTYHVQEMLDETGKVIRVKAGAQWP